MAWDDSHPGGSISVVLLPLWRTSARVNRRIGFVRQWDDASARLWFNVEPGRCIRLVESQISALSVSRYEIWGPNEGHAVKRHDLGVIRIALILPASAGNDKFVRGHVVTTKSKLSAQRPKAPQPKLRSSL